MAKIICNLGDEHPFEYGGWFVMDDSTAVVIDPERTDKGVFCRVYKFNLDQFSFDVEDRVLFDSANCKSPSWVDKHLDTIASFSDIQRSTLVNMLCSPCSTERAVGYRAIGSCLGYENLDSYSEYLSLFNVMGQYRSKYCSYKKLRDQNADKNGFSAMSVSTKGVHATVNEPNLAWKLSKPEGVCTSIAKSDKDNATIIKFVLDQFLEGQSLESSERTSDNWQAVDTMPQEFASNRFRIRR